MHRESWVGKNHICELKRNENTTLWAQYVSMSTHYFHYFEVPLTTLGKICPSSFFLVYEDSFPAHMVLGTIPNISPGLWILETRDWNFRMIFVCIAMSRSGLTSWPKETIWLLCPLIVTAIWTYLKLSYLYCSLWSPTCLQASVQHYCLLSFHLKMSPAPPPTAHSDFPLLITELFSFPPQYPQSTQKADSIMPRPPLWSPMVKSFHSPSFCPEGKWHTGRWTIC